MASKQQSGGMGLFGVLTIIFVVLKLCELINWSWWWVLAPTWIPATIVVFVMIIGFIAGCCLKK